MFTFPILERVVTRRDGRRFQQYNDCPVAPHLDAFGTGLPSRANSSGDVGL